MVCGRGCNRLRDRLRHLLRLQLLRLLLWRRLRRLLLLLWRLRLLLRRCRGCRRASCCCWCWCCCRSCRSRRGLCL